MLPLTHLCPRYTQRVLPGGGREPLCCGLAELHFENGGRVSNPDHNNCRDAGWSRDEKQEGIMEYWEGVVIHENDYGDWAYTHQYRSEAKFQGRIACRENKTPIRVKLFDQENIVCYRNTSYDSSNPQFDDAESLRQAYNTPYGATREAEIFIPNEYNYGRYRQVGGYHFTLYELDPELWSLIDKPFNYEETLDLRMMPNTNRCGTCPEGYICEEGKCILPEEESEDEGLPERPEEPPRDPERPEEPGRPGEPGVPQKWETPIWAITFLFIAAILAIGIAVAVGYTSCKRY